MTVDDLVNEFLDIEKAEQPKQFTFRDRLLGITHRREIEKQIKDEQEADKTKILQSGKLAKDFIEGIYYKNLIRPLFEQDIKGGIQRLIREGETMSEVELKTEISSIKKAISKIAAIRLKIIQADMMKEDNGKI